MQSLQSLDQHHRRCRLEGRRGELLIVPVGSVRDEFVERKWIEIGPEGMRVDVRDYQDEWGHEIAERVTKDAILSKIKGGELPTEEELDQLAAALVRSRAIL